MLGPNPENREDCLILGRIALAELEKIGILIDDVIARCEARRADKGNEL